MAGGVAGGIGAFAAAAYLTYILVGPLKRTETADISNGLTLFGIGFVCVILSIIASVAGRMLAWAGVGLAMALVVMFSGVFLPFLEKKSFFLLITFVSWSLAGIIGGAIGKYVDVMRKRRY